MSESPNLNINNYSIEELLDILDINTVRRGSITSDKQTEPEIKCA